jgi:hypothetical protein
MTLARLAMVVGLILVGGCSSSPPPPKVESISEPKVADDLPTWCSEDKKPCVPPRDFAARLCRGQFRGAALFLFQKQSPWQRRWVNVKTGLAAHNGEGGPEGGALQYAEELLIMAVDAPAEAAAVTASDKQPKVAKQSDRAKTSRSGKARDAAKKTDQSLLLLRWDGTCASLKESETVMVQPAIPKNPPVDWSKLDLSVKRSLLRDSELGRDAEACDKACGSAASLDCRKAQELLSTSIVKGIRRGIKLSMPEQRP